MCRKIKQHVIPTTPCQNMSLFGGEFYKRGQVKGWFKWPAAAIFFFILNVEPLQLAIRHLMSSVSLYRECWGGKRRLELTGTKSSFRETTGQETLSTKSTNKKKRSQDRCNLRFSSPDLFDFPSPPSSAQIILWSEPVSLSVLILNLPSLLSLLSLQIKVQSVVHICGCNYICHLQWPVSVFLLYVHCKRPEGIILTWSVWQPTGFEPVAWIVCKMSSSSGGGRGEGGGVTPRGGWVLSSRPTFETNWTTGYFLTKRQDFSRHVCGDKPRNFKPKHDLFPTLTKLFLCLNRTRP